MARLLCILFVLATYSISSSPTLWNDKTIVADSSRGSGLASAAEVFTNDFIIKLKPDVEKKYGDELARELEFINHGQVKQFLHHFFSIYFSILFHVSTGLILRPSIESKAKFLDCIDIESNIYFLSEFNNLGRKIIHFGNIIAK